MQQARQRLFELEIGFQPSNIEFTFDSLHTKIQKGTNHKVIFDDTLLVYKVQILDQAHLLDFKPRMENFWYTKTEIEELSNKWPGIDLCILRQNWQPINEYEFEQNYHLNIQDL